MKKIKIFLFFTLIFVSLSLFSKIYINKIKKGKFIIYKIETEKLSFEIEFKNGILKNEIIKNKISNKTIKTDGNFRLEIVFSGWTAPGKIQNSENPVFFDKKFFILSNWKINLIKDGEQSIVFELKSRVLPFVVLMEYRFFDGKEYFKRRIYILKNQDFKRSSVLRSHFLDKVYPLFYRVQANSNFKIIKKGGYGQPSAIKLQKGGIFFGLEYPSSYNEVSQPKKELYVLKCFQYIGENITKTPLKSDWAVFGFISNSGLRYSFFNYLKDIKVGKLRPYLLYNSWYDLRAPEMVKNKKNIMNEENSLRIYSLLKEKLSKYGLKLDAFVLDDGWDVYRSDWVLSKEQFPSGLKPLSSVLGKNKTSLGIWFGPTGGYSHRDWRVSWMREYGYETVGTQMCFGGKNYFSLLKRRILEFTKKYRVGYYKWDGFQFICNEKGHGHPVGIYSRRHILNNLIFLSKSVRKLNPDVFLNITSGTWLSPWWVKIADTIWMQGFDYGYSEVPSISKRDMAMTYRDYVLFEDFKKYDFWFPVENLMTHGIIKGDLQKLGGEEEPIEKFTNNAVLYFARGISMYELYITPDLLSKAEWDALAKSIKWAKENFDVLTNYTVMVGGDPGKSKAYGFIHFKDKKGIIALRNPSFREQKIILHLKPEYGLNKDANNLVLEKIYPKNFIYNTILKSNDSITITLNPYETAIFNLYPLGEAKYPLLANVFFSKKQMSSNEIVYSIFSSKGEPVILNKKLVKKLVLKGKRIKSLKNLNIKKEKNKNFISIKIKEKDSKKVVLNIKVKEKTVSPELALLAKGEIHTNTKKSILTLRNNSRAVKPKIIKGEGWIWYIVKLKKGEQVIEINRIASMKNLKIKIFKRFFIQKTPQIILIKTRKKVKDKMKLPLPYSTNLFKQFEFLGEF